LAPGGLLASLLYFLPKCFHTDCQAFFLVPAGYYMTVCIVVVVYRQDMKLSWIKVTLLLLSTLQAADEELEQISSTSTTGLNCTCFLM